MSKRKKSYEKENMGKEDEGEEQMWRFLSRGRKGKKYEKEMMVNEDEEKEEEDDDE